MSTATREFTAYVAVKLHDNAEQLTDPGAAMRAEMVAAELQAIVLNDEGKHGSESDRLRQKR